MQIDYIRRDVNEAISEDGGAFIQLVNKNTIGLKSSISEAKAALYVVGADSMIEGYFVGIMRSVFEGIKEDGHPRTVGDITFYPVCGGTFDLDKGWDPKVNDVRIKARLLNGITLDVTDWTFRDVTEGRVSFTLETVSNGTVTGLVSKDKDAELNGKNFPAKEKLSVFWSCGLKGGEVPSDKFTANVARITIDKSVFGTLSAEDDGKDIVFTVKGCYNKTSKSATFKYVEVPIAATEDGKCKVMTFKDGASSTEFTLGHSWTGTGSGFYVNGEAPEGEWAKDEVGLTIGEKYVSFSTTIAADHKSFTLGAPTGETIDPGTYENVTVKFYLTRGSQSATLSLPIAKLIVA